MRTITVRGRAELSREPDIAELVCTVRGEDLEYGAAYEKLIAAQGALFAAFRKEGYADKDFKTGAFRVSRKSAYEKDGNVNREVFGGYLFVNTVTLAFPCESARLGKAVGAAVGSGAGVDFFLRFSLRDEAAFKEKLLFAACADAKARAESIARACNVRLGCLVELKEEGEGRPLAAVRAFAAEPVAPEEIRSAESVVAVWEIV